MWYGFNREEQHALERAQVRGYLVYERHYHFTVYEAWRLSCARTQHPTVWVGSCGASRSVIADTSTVYEDELTGSPTLTPTERTQQQLARIVQRYVRKEGEPIMRLHGSYVFLPVTYPGSAEKVARLLLLLWHEAAFFASQQRLWQVEQVA